MTATLTTAAALIKDFYTEKRVHQQVFQNAPLLAMLPKKEDIEGDPWVVPIVTSNPQAGSATFATGQANKGSSSSSRFTISMADEYAFASINRKLIKACKTNKGAFLKQAKLEIDGALNVNRQSLGIQLYGDGSGQRGVVGASGVSGSTITLSNRHDAVKFPKGLKVQVVEPGVGLRASGAQLKVAGVNHKTGVITFETGVTATVSGTTDADILVRAGDYNAVLDGLGIWNPIVAPSGVFNGADRTNEPEALGGIRYDGTGQSVKEALLFGASECATLGDGYVDHWFLHPSQYRALNVEAADSVSPVKFETKHGLYFEGLEMRGDTGVARIFQDRYCPSTEARGLQLDTWELGSYDKCPDIFDRGTDQEMLRDAGSDGYEVRTGGYVNLSCCAPGKNVVVTLDAQD